jgi:branched-chain amino acid transport system ATP-binding protein
VNGGPATGDPAIRVEGLRAHYGAKTVLKGLDITVDRGEIAVVLGPNGAGKTTFLRALSGTVERSGSVTLLGRETAHLSSAAIAAARVAHVPEGRGTFTGMTVAENIRLGGYLEKRKDQLAERRDRCLQLFPRLKDRWRQEAGSLSGGEQQMLAVARALMMGPEILLLDEPSMGLAPKVTGEMFEVLSEIATTEATLTMVIVEQNAALSLRLADRGHILEAGQVVASGRAEDIRSDPALRRAYLGV